MRSPTIGRIVLFTLAAAHVADIEHFRNRRREGAVEAERLPAGAQGHKGNPVNVGDVVPALIVKTWGEGPYAAFNVKLFLDGTDSLWVTSVQLSEEPKQGFAHWHDWENPRGGALTGEAGSVGFASREGADGGMRVIPEPVAPHPARNLAFDPHGPRAEEGIHERPFELDETVYLRVGDGTPLTVVKSPGDPAAEVGVLRAPDAEVDCYHPNALTRDLAAVVPTTKVQDVGNAEGGTTEASGPADPSAPADTTQSEANTSGADGDSPDAPTTTGSREDNSTKSADPDADL